VLGRNPAKQSQLPAVRKRLKQIRRARSHSVRWNVTASIGLTPSTLRPASRPPSSLAVVMRADDDSSYLQIATRIGSLARKSRRFSCHCSPHSFLSRQCGEGKWPVSAADVSHGAHGCRGSTSSLIVSTHIFHWLNPDQRADQLDQLREIGLRQAAFLSAVAVWSNEQTPFEFMDAVRDAHSRSSHQLRRCSSSGKLIANRLAAEELPLPAQ